MHIIINGSGGTTEYLAEAMLESKHRVTIIEEDLEAIERLESVLSSRVTLVHGEGCDPDIMRDAGMSEADLFITLSSRDETNLVACELAMSAFNVPRCISSVSSPKNRRIFKALKIETVSATELIARMVEEQAITADMRMVFSLREGSIIMVEIKLPSKMRHREGIQVSELPAIREAQLIAVVRENGLEMINGDTYLLPGDSIIAAVESDSEEEFRHTIKHL